MLLTHVLKKITKAIVLLIFVAVISIVYVNISVTTTATYKCVGYAEYTSEAIAKYSALHPHITNEAKMQRTGFLQIEEGSRMTLLWSDFRHYVYWEGPGTLNSVWRGADDRRRLTLFDGEERAGQLSKASLQLNFSGPTERFYGVCEEVLR